MSQAIGISAPSAGTLRPKWRRTRPVATVLAVIATAAALAPVTSLVAPRTYLSDMAVAILAMAFVGLIGRSISKSALAIGAVQLLILAVAAMQYYTPQTTWYGVPTLATLQQWVSQLTEVAQEIAVSAAPLPTSTGVTMLLTISAGATMIVVDQLGVTRNAPLLAGIPLLTAYLIAAANHLSGLSVYFFVAAAATWLALLRLDTKSANRTWGPLASRRPAADKRARASLTRRLWPIIGIGSLVLGVLAPSIVPHLPARYLGDGLSRTPDGTGGSGNALTSVQAVGTSLTEQSDAQRFIYRPGSDFGIDAWRVGVATDYIDGNWINDTPETMSPTNRFPTTTTISPSVPRNAHTVAVEQSTLAAPQLALPTLTTALSAATVGWSAKSDGTAAVRSPAASYTATYLELKPSQNQLDDGGKVELQSLDVEPTYPDGDLVYDPQDLAKDLVVPEQSLLVPYDDLPVVSKEAARHVREGSTSIEAALALQDYLRGPDFTYSLTLKDPPIKNGEPVGPVEAFLKTKQGYCVQFASAMVLMARSVGIPARLAYGFLPGRPNPDGSWSVRSADAHAWPELYFKGLGWLRFEPTPGGRAGQPPEWAREAPTTPTPTASETPTPTQSEEDEEVTAAQEVAPQGNEDSSIWGRVTANAPRIASFTGVALAVIVLLALLTPTAARVARARARRRAVSRAEKSDVIWSQTLQRIDDLGIPIADHLTPRQVGSYVTDRARLSEAGTSRVNELVSTIELARYADSDELPDPTALHKTGARLVAEVAHSRSLRARVRARLWPEAGLQTWRRWLGMD